MLHFGDAPLRRRGVVLFDDGFHAAARIAQDAAVAGGVGELHGEQRHRLAVHQRQQLAQHRGRAAAARRRTAPAPGGRPESPAWPASRAWPVPFCSACSAQCRSLCANAARTASAPWPCTTCSARRFQLPRGVEHMAEQRPSAQRLQHLGQAGVHALALARREDDHRQWRAACGGCGLGLRAAGLRERLVFFMGASSYHRVATQLTAWPAQSSALQDEVVVIVRHRPGTGAYRPA